MPASGNWLAQMQYNRPNPVGVDQMKRKNALADRGMALDEERNAQYGRQLDMTAESQRRNFEQQDSDARFESLERFGSVARKALSLDPVSRRQFLKQAVVAHQDAFRQMGKQATPRDVDETDDAGLEQWLQMFAQFGGQGQPSNEPLETVVGPDGQPVLRPRSQAAGERPYIKPDKPVGGPHAPSGYAYQPDGSLSPIAGGPADPNRQRPLSPAQEKLRQAVAVKLPQVDAAVRRVERLAKASENLGNFLADGGPVDGAILAKTPSGQELEQAGASFMPILTALTRVPGIGSQSDLEQRLALLQLPTSSMYPAVRARAIAELRQFMADLKQAYQNIAQGGGAPMPEEAAGAGPAASAPAGGGGWSIQEVK